MTTTVEVVEVTDEAWATERDAITARFLGLTAAEFVERYEAGVYDSEDVDGLMAVLAFFPELD